MCKVRNSQKGFTLFELVVVLAIISAMVAVALPFCKRSNSALKIRQLSSSIAQIVRYAIDMSEKKKESVKFIYNDKFKSYHLEIQDSQNDFKPVNDFTGTETFFSENIYLFDIEGFDQAGQEYFLVLDPKKTWPDAWISFSDNNLVVTVKIKSKHDEIREESI